MRKHPLLFGFALLLSPVMLLSIIYFDRLEKEYREIFPPDDPLAYRSKSLKCKVAFTNQMLTDPELFASYHYNPKGETRFEGCVGDNSGLPLRSKANRRPLQDMPVCFGGDMRFWVLWEPEQPDFSDDAVEVRIDCIPIDNLGHARSCLPQPPKPDPTPKDWPVEQPLEIELNSKLRSTLQDGIVTIKNTSNEPIYLSNKFARPAVTFTFDEEGRLWHLESTLTTEQLNAIEGIDILENGTPSPKTIEKVLQDKQYAVTCIEPKKSIYFVLPVLSHHYKYMTKGHKLVQCIVLVGDNDKIIHVFERPCDNTPTPQPRLQGIGP